MDTADDVIQVIYNLEATASRFGFASEYADMTGDGRTFKALSRVHRDAEFPCMGLLSASPAVGTGAEKS